MFRFAVALGLVAAVGGNAHAGRSFFGWLYGTEVLPERGVELQTWVAEENRTGANHERTTSIWWGPLIGITDQLELALPIEALWYVADDRKPGFTVDRFGVEARYRFVSQDPVDRPAFAPLARLAIKRDVVARDSVRLEGDFVAAYDAGPVQILGDVGFVCTRSASAPNLLELHPGAGVSVEVIDDLRFGVEGYGEIELKSGGDKWFIAGPNMAWTHGRFWLSAAFGIGLTGIQTAPRVQWGILF